MGSAFSREVQNVIQRTNSERVVDENNIDIGDLLIISALGISALHRAFQADGKVEIENIKESGIKKGKRLGEGSFGVVYEGTFCGKKVAIKEIESSTSVSFGDLKKEADVMRDLQHENVIELIEVVTNKICFVIVMEYMENGDLCRYLQDQRVNRNQMKQFAIDIANGMWYLAERNIVHRDLAARNVLLDAKLRAKVADFGLSRVLQPQSTYLETVGTFPLLWTAPEGFKGRYSKESDVWSYGIVLIEIVTRGKRPYRGDTNPGEIQKFLHGGRRHSKPDNCSDALYGLMMSCWNDDPSQRPSFGSISASLSSIPF